MADSKISALPASTTPLAGTEVLPIVQSSATKQVSVANLTAGRAISATQLTLTTGNLIVASGQGVDFSATAGTGTSELLNDYEEGTWTPTLNSFTVVSQTSLSGTYTKIGRQVFLNIIVTATSIAAVAGTSTITNLPFAPGIQNFSMVTLADANTIGATNSGGVVNSASNGTLYSPATSGNSYMVISAVYTV